MLDAFKKSGKPAQNQAEELEALIATSREERAALSTMLTQMQLQTTKLATAGKSLQEVDDKAGKAHARLDEILGRLATADTRANELDEETTRTREASRTTREESEATAQLLQDVEKRLGPLAELRDMSQTTEERMATLNALAEHVNQKIKALENQKHTVERAVVESNRLNEMIWAMDVQINKLNESGLQAARTEELIDRVEALSREASGQVEAATTARDGFARDLVKLEKDRSTLAEFGHAFTDRLTVDRAALEAFDRRVKGLQASVADTEKKLDEQATCERRIEDTDQRLGQLGKQLEQLHADAAELQRKQSALESLRGSLAAVDELAKKTASQYESVDKGRQQVETLRGELREVFKSHASAVQLQDRLSSDRAALESFLDRVDSFTAGVPELQNTLNAIQQKLAAVDEGTDKADALATLAADLDGRMARLATQEQLVEKVAGRLDALGTTTVDVDRKLDQQIMRRGELDALRSQMDGVAIQVSDARQKLEAVSAVQQQLLPLTAQLSTLTGQIETAQARFLAAQKDEASIADQERRLSALDERARVASGEVASRLAEVKALSGELHRSVTVKNELVEELSGVQARQQDVVIQLDAADDQLKRLETTATQLEQRRSQLAFAEKRIGAFENRLVDLGQMANQIEGTIQRLAERESVVEAVRREVEAVHEISARSKADLDHVEAHRTEMVTLRDKLDGLLGAIADTETRIAAIDGRRKVVDEVQLKTNVIVNMLEDVRLNMDTLGEHKTIMEQAMADFTRLTELVQESQNTLRALKAERELAGRIEHGTKRLRAKTDRGQTGTKASQDASPA
jgi:DNA repair exonuclease SbcCD ATPase subunit